MAGFTDAKGWYPGIEARPSGLFYRDADASVVIPSKGNAPTPPGSPTRTAPRPRLYGAKVGSTVLGSGSPGDQNVASGVTITILRTAKDNSYATVHVTAATP